MAKNTYQSSTGERIVFDTSDLVAGRRNFLALANQMLSCGRTVREVNDVFHQLFTNIRVASPQAAQQLAAMQRQIGMMLRGANPAQNIRQELLRANLDVTRKKVEELRSTFRTTTSAVVALFAAFKSTTAAFGFVDGITQINAGLKTMAENAGLSAEALRSATGAIRAFGGGDRSEAALHSSYLLEQSRMAHGQGVGGKWIDAARYFGIAFNPHDWEAQKENYVKFLSDPNQDKGDKLNLKGMLGLDDATFSAWSSGLENYRALNRASKENARGRDEAADAARRLKVETAKLADSWESLKSQVMLPLVKAITPVVSLLTRLLRPLKQMPEWMRIAVAAVAGVGVTFVSVTGSVLAFRVALASLKSVLSTSGISFFGGFGGGLGRFSRQVGAGIGILSGAAGAFEAYSSLKAERGDRTGKTDKNGGWKLAGAAMTTVGSAAMLIPGGQAVGGVAIALGMLISILASLTEKATGVSRAIADNTKTIETREREINMATSWHDVMATASARRGREDVLREITVGQLHMNNYSSALTSEEMGEGVRKELVGALSRFTEMDASRGVA